MYVRPSVSLSCVGHEKLCVSAYLSLTEIWLCLANAHVFVSENHSFTETWLFLTCVYLCFGTYLSHTHTLLWYSLTHSLSCPTHERETLGLTHISLSHRDISAPDMYASLCEQISFAHASDMRDSVGEHLSLTEIWFHKSCPRTFSTDLCSRARSFFAI